MRRWMLATTLLILGSALASVAADTPTAGKDRPGAEAAMAFDRPPAPGTRARCPVSKEVFTVSDKTARSEYKGKHYVFCCPDCKPQFDENPAAYVDATKPPASGTHH
jgi:YHS domain-containing protein